VTLTGTNNDTGMNGTTRFQNNIQSIFSRLRVLYGATPLEDIISRFKFNPRLQCYRACVNRVVFLFNPRTATDQLSTMDQTCIFFN